MFKVEIMSGLYSWQAAVDIGWLVLLFIVFYHFWQARAQLAEAKSWLITKGKITHCEWVTMGQSIWPKIEYSYEVYNKELVGHYLFLDTAHNNPNSTYARRVAYRVALAFKDNSDIDVYYNPNHPEQSALDVIIPKKLNVILIVVGALILLQVAMILSRFF